jgi:uncharacterized protein (DUF1697 family)
VAGHDLWRWADAIVTKHGARYLAFLRGMNVGGHRVSMAELRTHFERLGLTDVETFIASGNVIFTAAESVAVAVLERTIEAQLRDALGYAVATFLRTPAELRAIAANVPFPADAVGTPGHTVHVGFLRQAPESTVARTLTQHETAMDAFGVHAREFYWLCRGKSTESLVKWPMIEKAVALDLTMRNLTTVRKLVDKYA